MEEYEVKYLGPGTFNGVFVCELGPVGEDWVRYTAVARSMLEAVARAYGMGNGRRAGVDWLTVAKFPHASHYSNLPRMYIGMPRAEKYTS